MLSVPQRPGQSGTLELGPQAGEPGAEPVVVPRVAEYPRGHIPSASHSSKGRIQPLKDPQGEDSLQNNPHGQEVLILVPT